VAPSYLGLALLGGGKSEESLPHFSTAFLKADLTVAHDNLQRVQRQIDAKKMKRSRDCAEFQFM
jgi:hypothetical protein